MYLYTKRIEDTVLVTVARDNATKNIALTLAQMPGLAESPPLAAEPPKPQLKLLGMNSFYDDNQYYPNSI